MSDKRVATNPRTDAAPFGRTEGSGPEVSSFVLDNGLDVVVIPDRRVPVVTHMVWYRNGSADDPLGQSGIAHFLEHEAGHAIGLELHHGLQVFFGDPLEIGRVVE